MDHESEARRRKAVKLAGWCRQMGFTAELVVHDFTQAIRDQACKDAGVNRASAQTWELVVGLLAAHESPAFQEAVNGPNGDPFEGLA